jgi:hypothetical protein
MAVARRRGFGSGRAIFTSARTQTIRNEIDHERAEHRAAGWNGAWWTSNLWPRLERFGSLGHTDLAGDRSQGSQPFIVVMCGSIDKYQCHRNVRRDWLTVRRMVPDNPP